MRPNVSVIVPVHNVAKYLERCVSSLRNQTLRDIEIVLVDDGSTDASSAMCDSYEQNDSRVRVVHQMNGGVSDARNTGLSIARGAFIAFLDGDDWAEPTMLLELTQTAESAAADVVIAGCIVDVEDDDGRLHSQHRMFPGSSMLQADSGPPALTGDLIRLTGYAWNKLYRHDLLTPQISRFPVGISLFEDMFFNANVLTAARRTVLCDRAYVHYVQRPRETLGSAFYSDFLELRLRAIAGVGAVYAHWGASSTDVEQMLTQLRLVALRSLARRTSEHADWSLGQKARYFSNSRRRLDGLVRVSDLTHKQRIELVALQNLPAGIVILAFHARSRIITRAHEDV